MLLIIDGYNLIKTILKKSHVNCKEINTFIETVIAYITKKQYKAIIVFDGFNNLDLNYKYHAIINIVYSKNQSADDYIKKYIGNYIKNNDKNKTFLITSDQEIKKFAYKLGVESIDSYTFYHKINKDKKNNANYTKNNTGYKTQKATGQIYKLNNQNNQFETEESKELDALMEEGCKRIVYKEQDYKSEIKNNKTKKNKKKINKILKKL